MSESPVVQVLCNVYEIDVPYFEFRFGNFSNQFLKAVILSDGSRSMILNDISSHSSVVFLIGRLSFAVCVMK